MAKFKNLLLSGILFATTTAALVAGSAPVLAAEPQPSVIHVTGYAEQELAPDTAFVTMTMETTASEAENARINNNQVMNKLVNGLKTLGIEGADMKTLNYSLRPVYDNNSKKIIRYKVNNSLKVKVKDLNLLSKVLGKGAECGVNRIGNVEFTCSRMAQVKAELIGAAVANGRMVAQAAATAAGGQLGKVKEINVNGHFPTFQMRAVKANMAMASMDAAENMADEAPMEAGTQKVSESVNLVFYIE